MTKVSLPDSVLTDEDAVPAQRMAQRVHHQRAGDDGVDAVRAGAQDQLARLIVALAEQFRDLLHLLRKDDAVFGILAEVGVGDLEHGPRRAADAAGAAGAAGSAPADDDVVDAEVVDDDDKDNK